MPRQKGIRSTCARASGLCSSRMGLGGYGVDEAETELLISFRCGVGTSSYAAAWPGAERGSDGLRQHEGDEVMAMSSAGRSC